MNPKEPQDLPQPGEPARLPYEPPAVVSEEIFETLALGCTKTGSQFACTQNPPTSS